MATNFKVAKRYARALWLLAEAEKNPAKTAEEWMNALEGLKAQIEASAPLASVFGSAAVSAEQKWAVLKDVATKLGVPPGVERFLEHTTKAGRLPMLSEIIHTFTSQVWELTGVAEVLVESAIDLNAEELGRIAAQVERYTGKKAKMKFRKDPALLAGFKTTVAGKTFDATLANNLQRMKRQLLLAEA